MKKIKVDVKRIVLELFWQRDADPEDRKKWIKYSQMCDEFLQGLSEEKIEAFEKIDAYREELEGDNEEWSVNFIFEIFKGFYN